MFKRAAYDDVRRRASLVNKARQIITRSWEVLNDSEKSIYSNQAKNWVCYMCGRINVQRDKKDTINWILCTVSGL